MTRLVRLGTPHTGARLERTVAATAALLGRFVSTAPLARLLALRSDGVKDLAKGHLHRDQWLDAAADVPTMLPPASGSTSSR